MYFKPINILLCLGRKHKIDYSCDYYTSKYIWPPVYDRNINHGRVFLFEASVIPLCQTAVSYSHAIPFICWHSSHGFIMEYSLLGGKDPLFHIRITVHYMGTKLMWPMCPMTLFVIFFWKEDFQDFLFEFDFPNTQSMYMGRKQSKRQTAKLPSVFNKRNQV